jgi:hypothetical protein
MGTVWQKDRFVRIWNKFRGAYVGDVLDMVIQIGGVATGGGEGVPARLRLTSWEQHWSSAPGNELTEDRIAHT